jgi:hypothetical protein
MIHSRALVLTLSLGLAACGTSVDPPDQTGTENENEADYETLASCGEAACESAFAQRIELGQPFTINDMECVLAAMRDRTPGLYLVTLNHTWSNGGESSDFALLVTASGEVEVGVQRDFSTTGPGSGSKKSWDPTETCSLAAPSFFESCLLAVQSDVTGEDAWACIYPGESQELPWFEGCKAQAPECK